jgi:excisionase family DNA binding protein
MSMTAQKSDVFDYRTASLYVGVSERYLRNEVAKGRITLFHAGRAVRFHREDLDAWVEMMREEERQRNKPRRRARARARAAA